MAFTDIHIHLLCGVDDGAKQESEMYAMFDAAYRAGTRLLCCTPHFHPGYFGDSHDKTADAFQRLERYVNANYTDVSVYLGNELRYEPECLAWLREGTCRTINGTRYVLVDFSETAPEKEITSGLNALLNAGYCPVLAHVERYRALHRKLSVIDGFWRDGVLLQADTRSLFRGFGLLVQRQCKKLLSLGLVDFFSSDAHDRTTRPPEMDTCFHYLQKKYGSDCAVALCSDNAARLLRGEAVRKDFSLA